MDKDLNRDAVKAIHVHYSCQGICPCEYFDDCQFGNGCNTSYDCCEWGADEFYEGYIWSLSDKANEGRTDLQGSL